MLLCAAWYANIVMCVAPIADNIKYYVVREILATIVTRDIGKRTHVKVYSILLCRMLPNCVNLKGTLALAHPLVPAFSFPTT